MALHARVDRGGGLALVPASRRGGVPEWLKGADCKSAGVRLRWFESNPLHHAPDQGPEASSSIIVGLRQGPVRDGYASFRLALSQAFPPQHLRQADHAAPWGRWLGRAHR
jgi:hypothetical protein